MHVENLRKYFKYGIRSCKPPGGGLADRSAKVVGVAYKKGVAFLYIFEREVA